MEMNRTDEYIKLKDTDIGISCDPCSKAGVYATATHAIYQWAPYTQYISVWIEWAVCDDCLNSAPQTTLAQEKNT